MVARAYGFLSAGIFLCPVVSLVAPRVVEPVGSAGIFFVPQFHFIFAERLPEMNATKRFVRVYLHSAELYPLK